MIDFESLLLIRGFELDWFGEMGFHAHFLWYFFPGDTIKSAKTFVLQPYIVVLVLSGMKHDAYEPQKGICAKCRNISRSRRWRPTISLHGTRAAKTIASNCQMLCKQDNWLISGK
jgi:hypothetical protein